MSTRNALTKNINIVAAKRTAFGNFGGAVKDKTPTQLAVVATTAAIEASGLPAEVIDTMVMGNVSQTAADTAYVARHAALKSGLSIETPALTVNRLCGSGFESIIQVAKEMQLGEAKSGIAGGTESMSQAPYAVRGVRFGTQLGKNPPMEDTLWAALTDSHAKVPMAITAENLAEKYSISKEECDEFALRSQQRWAEANEAGRFNSEIQSMDIKTRKGLVHFDTDEGPRPQTTLEALSRLPALFKENGTVSAGNASGITDGAGSLVLADDDMVAEHGLKPLARIVSYAVFGVEPTVMGIGPVPAVRAALEKIDMTVKDMDLIEINEAFAAQALAVGRELNVDWDKVNVDGGAISLGHPLAASGSRIMGHLAHQLVERDLTYGVGSACIGGGQGIAVVIERL